MSAHDDSVVVIVIPTASDFNFFQTPSTAKCWNDCSACVLYAMVHNLGKDGWRVLCSGMSKSVRPC